MKKTLITILLMLSLAIPNVLFAYPPMPRGWMTLIPTDLDAIDSPADTEVPSYDSATGKFEWIASGGSGDVTSVGSVDAAGCTSGACLDGTSDGGTKILFYDAQGATTLVGGDTAGAITLTLPIVTGTIYATGNTDVAVADGGTGAGTHTDGGILIGNGTGALVALGVASNGQIPIGDGDKDPQLANITETGDALVVTNGAGSIALSAHATLEAVADSGYTGDDAITTVGTIAAGTWQSTDIGVAYGGTGASSFTDGGILLGATTGAIEVTAAGGVGEILVGVAASNPKWLATSTAGYQLTNNGAADPSWNINRDFCVTDFTCDEAQGTLSAANMIACEGVTNSGGADAETDILLVAISYPMKIVFKVEEANIMEICPPSGEAFDLNGTDLAADDCVDSPAVVFSKMAATRMQNAAGAWIWSLDTIRGAWVDTDAAD